LRMVENIAHDSLLEPLVRSRMLAAMNSRFRDIAFVRARVAAMRGLTTEALEVARILEERFCAPSHARCIRLLASQSYLGTLSRAAMTTQRFRSYSRVVDDSLDLWKEQP